MAWYHKLDLFNWFKKKPENNFWFKPKSDVSFKEFFNAQVTAVKASRKSMGLEPDSSSWAMLTDMAVYILSFPMTTNTREIVHSAYNVFKESEAEMDYDRACVAVSTMCYFASPPRHKELDPQYTERIFNEYLRHKSYGRKEV